MSLAKAALDGDLERVKQLIGKSNIHQTDGIASPLSRAAQKGYIEIMKVLLAAGADVNRRDPDSSIPIHTAAFMGRTEAVKLLIAAGADVNIAMYNGSTPIIAAASYGYPEIVKILIAAGADVNKTLDNGATPLFLASYTGYPEVIKVLLTAGADMNKANNNDETPLFVAAQEGKHEVIKVLLTAGADMNKANKNGITPLFIASYQGHLEAVKVLLAAGADVNNAGHVNGITPLSAAAQNGHLEVVKALLAAGADVNKTHHVNGMTPLFIAAQEGHTKVVKSLLAAGANVHASMDNVTPLFIAAQKGKHEVVKALLAAGADVNKANNNGETPLYMAVLMGFVDIVKTLIDAGANIHTPKGDVSPLFMAAQQGFIKILKYLIAAGAEVNKARTNGATPLFIAAFTRLEVVQALLDAGANIYEKAPYIPYEYAKENKFKPEINELILSKAQPIEQSKPTWKGLTQSNFTKYNTIFDTEAPAGSRSVAENTSLCPICLKYVLRDTGCLYMTHNCSKEKGYYHKALYDKYKSPAGDIVWCSCCGRICNEHVHYQLGFADGPKPGFAPKGQQWDPFEKDCRVSNGGGGLPEKLARYQRLREISLTLQSEIDKIEYETACNDLVEEAWNAPLLVPHSGVTKRKLNTIQTTRKWNFPSSVLPTNAPNTSTKPSTAGYSSEGKFKQPVLYMPGEAGYAGNNIGMNYESPVVQFIHKPYKGGEFNDHVYIEGPGGAAGATETKVFVTKDTLVQFLKGYGTHGGDCFDGKCKANLYPEEIELAFKALEQKMGAGYVTEKDKELLQGYVEFFKEKMTTMGGGYRRSRTRRQKGGGEFVLPFFQKAEQAQCVMPPKRSIGGKTRQKRLEKRRKTRRL